jgi:hypothetical protein
MGPSRIPVVVHLYLDVYLHVLFAFVVAGLSGTAYAQAPTRVRFEYQRYEGGTVCPDASAIEVGVAGRLGYDPFDEKAADSLQVTIRPAAHGLEARVEMRDVQGQLKAERRLLSRQRDCKELASSVELAISIAVDPSGAGANRPPVEAPAPPAAEAAPPQTAEPREEPFVRRPLTGEASAIAIGGFRSAPSPSLGLGIGASLAGDFLSLGVEGRADLPSSSALHAGSVRTSLLTASLVPCLRGPYLGFCALASAGVLRGAGVGLVDSRHVSFFYAAVGARAALGIPMGPRWSLVVHADVSSPLTETTLTVDGETVWSSPTLVFALGLGVTARIP